MSLPDAPGGAGALDFLGRLARRREPAERCELCGAAIAPHPRHEHLLDPQARQLQCSCTACALLFPAEAQKRFRRVPRRLWHLAEFDMSDAEWDALAIPVGIAALHTTAPSGAVRAFYPSPAGATESLLTIEGWDELVRRNPLLGGLQPDVEALLVHRVRGARDHFIAPIDRCYELVGLIRLTWRGLSGGSEVWQRIDAYFAGLREEAVVKGVATHA